jgi:hypothetical protein
VPQTALTIALHRGFYIAIIMEHYEGHQTAHTIALHGGLYLAIMMEPYEWTQISLTISLVWRPLINHYNGPL